MEQIIVHELPRYLSLKDQNTLCSLNKEMYGKLRSITPFNKEMMGKKKVHRELSKATTNIFFWVEYLTGKTNRIRRWRKTTYFDENYIYYEDQGETLRLEKSKEESFPKYLWVIKYNNQD